MTRLRPHFAVVTVALTVLAVALAPGGALPASSATAASGGVGTGSWGQTASNSSVKPAAGKSAPRSGARTSKRRAEPWYKRKFGSRKLRFRNRGRDVKGLQGHLSKLGIPTGRDGVFGLQTHRNVKALERARGWKPNGRVSRKEAKKMKRMAKRGRRFSTGTGSIFFHFSGRVPAVEVTTQNPGTVVLDLVATDGDVIWSYDVEFDSAGTRSLPWYGKTSRGGAAPDGTYGFAIGNGGTVKGVITGGQRDPFAFRRHIFPVRGPHNFGSSGSVFGAPRGDHRHQGQDVAADCGTPMVAPAGGTVVTRSYQAGGAGYYIVIRARSTGQDYVFMHMQTPGPLATGDKVLTGQEIGRVGTTGSSTGCHLHFERWGQPGWYQGGAPFDPLPGLKYWDRYS